MLCATLTACEKKQSVLNAPVDPPRNANAVAVVVGDVERGEASWYGEPYHGRRAASGEVYDMEQLTAAHRTLPFQTWVEVTNVANGKQVNVRITDRGPFVDGRIIDLSRAAAREIDLLRAGIAKVELRIIEAPADSIPTKPVIVSSNTASEKTVAVNTPAVSAPIATQNPPEPQPTISAPRPTLTAGYAVQAGAFKDRNRAEAMAASLLVAGARVVGGDAGSGIWRVWVGSGLDMDAANALLKELQAVVGSAFIVRDQLP